MKAFKKKIKILDNLKIGERSFKLVFASGQIAAEASPGQFVMLGVNQGRQPLLKRPFSIHNIRPKSIELLYEVVGKGTESLSQKKSGEYLDVIGPLGKGFDYQPSAISHQSSVIVAGGMGIAPLIFLAEKLRQRKTLVLIGAKTKNHVLCEKEFKRLGCEVKVSTDDGSRGFKGKVTDLLKNLLPTTYYLLPTVIYACGPKPMLKQISGISKEYNLPAQISLETHMACGFGACLGCAVNTIEGYKRVCKDGPVFKADEIIWAE